MKSTKLTAQLIQQIRTMTFGKSNFTPIFSPHKMSHSHTNNPFPIDICHTTDPPRAN